ncbi:ankyrin repeat protein [Mycena rebaudengoi]|nr:ankyrin repeat protein [Mycena rebaudengoi]
MQTPEAKAFIERIVGLPKGPGVSLDLALQPSLEDETELRRLFATDKANARLSNPYVGLVDVFDAPSDIRTTRVRVVKDEEDLSARHVMPLSELNRRAEGAPSTVADIDEFKKNWGVFSEGSLSQLTDWSNVVAAGGAVLACLSPLSEESKASKRAIRKYYHSAAYPTSDVDLFLWGMTPEEAEVKIVKIYEAVRDSVPWDVTCVRTKHTVSIHSQYPYRSVQIVLRLYSSPAEILAGFDIDAPCCAYNGDRVYANPRAIVAMMRQCNTVDMTRRSPSYEVRLAKYAARTFEVYVPSLVRANIDPTIYERSIARITGLARLLVLEKLTTTDIRFAFLESRRELRGRPNPLNRYNKRTRKRKGDLKADGAAIGGLEINDYDVASLHIPYGPGWDARRIDKLVYQTDLGMNSTFNPANKGRRLHRHPAFFGTIQECMEDCCEYCPAPIDADERKLQEEEDESYIRGRIAFIQEDPGRQTLSGSFTPIDVGEWSAQVYIGPTERFFAAIAAHDRAGVARMLKEADGGVDVNRRDHVGRAPLHVAILAGATEIACDLVDAGARMTARLVDGRTTLHLAAQHDQLVVVRKLLERSKVNAAQVGKDEEAEAEGAEVPVDSDRPSSEDDWSSEDDVMAVDDEEDGDNEDEDDMDEDEDDSEGKKPRKPKAGAAQPEVQTNVGDLPEDETDEPDVFDIDLADWDMLFSALDYAIVFASLPVVEEFINAGTDIKRVSQPQTGTSRVLPLALTILGDDDERCCKIAQRLLLAGASSSAGEKSKPTIFDQAVRANKANLVSTFLRYDPNAKAALNYPMVSWNGAITPLGAAIQSGNYAAIAALVAHGVKFGPVEEDIARAWADSPHSYYEKHFSYPMEIALNRHDYVARLLLDLGAEFNIGTKRAVGTNSRPEERRTLLEWTQYAVTELDKEIAKAEKAAALPDVAPGLTGWKLYLAERLRSDKAATVETEKTQTTYQDMRRAKQADIREYFVDMGKLFAERGAKPWAELYPHLGSTASDGPIVLDVTEPLEVYKTKYRRSVTAYQRDDVPAFLDPLYDELFEACFTGDNDRIQELCLPAGAVKKDANLLQVTVQIVDPADSSRYSTTYISPLTAAIAGRRWDTARLVMTIACAQYKPVEKKGKFVAESFDDDSDTESDDSNDSDYTIEQDGLNFVDIANRSSTIEVNAHPKLLLSDLPGLRDPLYVTVDADDFEAFVNVLNLYKQTPKHIDIPKHILESIIRKDRVDMLDEYIRRTGVGITTITAQPAQSDEADAPVVNDKNRVYLGLSVHGKKRTDLANRNDPNASPTDRTPQTPLVWQAIEQESLGILDYLLSDRVLTAYTFYAKSNSSDVAHRLRRTENLAKVLPEWLGWTITPMGESPLTAAVAYHKLEVIKHLFAKSPKLMASALHERVKFLGLNPLMIAIQRAGVEADVVDYLLAKSVSPAETDTIHGWNIFHYLCQRNDCELLEHLLKKLPRDVVEALLKQQSKGRLNTPLHLSVKTGAKIAVKLLVDFSKETVLVRDVVGCTPLHSAVRSGYPEISKILIAAAPAGLQMENGVGDVPLEIVTLKDLIPRKEAFQLRANGYGLPGDADLSYANGDSPPRFEIEQLEVELPKYRATIEALINDGVLKRGTKVVADMVAFADFMEPRLAEAKLLPKLEVKYYEVAKPPPPKDVSDNAKVLEVVRAELAKGLGGNRELVHLVDVQKSVQNDLKESRLPQVEEDNDEVLQEEPDPDSELQQRTELYIYSRVNVSPDGY